MSQTKVDYPALEREFITTDDEKLLVNGMPSLRKMAEREGISNSTLSDYARAHKWAEKRGELKQQELDKFINVTAEKNARRLARLSEITVDVLEGTLIRFAEQLTQHLDDEGKPSGKEPIFISAKDAQDAIKLIRDLSTQRQPEEGASGSSPVTINIGADLIAAVGELARGNLYPGGARAARPVPLPSPAEGDSGRDAASESA